MTTTSADRPPLHARLSSVRLLPLVVVGVAVGVPTGIAAALFLTLLNAATQTRVEHPSLVLALPLAGLVMGWLADRQPPSVRASAGEVRQRIRSGGNALDLFMAPWALVSTVVTHLAGGSAGREGTAVQFGGAISDWLSRRFVVFGVERQLWLTAGVAAGFGAVFGTPVAGTVFALEFGEHKAGWTNALLVSVVASTTGDLVTRAAGCGHSMFPELTGLAVTPDVLWRWVVLAAVVAVMVRTFMMLTDRVRSLSLRLMPGRAMRMMAGGTVVVLLWFAVGSSDYLGLGVPIIEGAFASPSMGHEVWALKLVFTAITVGFGFPGGEVTPLFFMGATLGSALGSWVGIPLPWAVGVSMVAAYGAAARVPLAMTVMAAELFGAGVLPHALLVNALAGAMAGGPGLYAHKLPVGESAVGAQGVGDT